MRHNELRQPLQYSDALARIRVRQLNTVKNEEYARCACAQSELHNSRQMDPGMSSVCCTS